MRGSIVKKGNAYYIVHDVYVDGKRKKVWTAAGSSSDEADHKLIEVLGAIFVKRNRDEWCRRLEANDVPHAPMYTTAEVPDDPQAKHLQLFIETEHPTVGRFRTVRSPVSFDGERALNVTAPPTLGEHDTALRDGWAARPPAPARAREDAD